MNSKNICLIGFMGSGKSTIGKALAEQRNKKFLDTDKYIENIKNDKIDNIINTKGIQYFRTIENEVALELVVYENTIISTGGGFCFNENFVKLKQNSIIIFLDVSYYEIKKRLINDKSRPLFDENSEKLYNQRYEIYNNLADYRVSNNNIKNTVKEIMEYYENCNS